ncbi:MAG: ATP-binding cassette domain-containing protein [Pirellulaceae bacterium]
MLVGLLTPSSGSGIVAGYDVLTEAEEIKKHIGYMSQKFSLYDDLTVEENINFYSGIYRIDRVKRQQRKEWVLEMAGLRDHRYSRTSILSGGWKQRLALGCCGIARAQNYFSGRADLRSRSDQSSPVLGPD